MAKFRPKARIIGLFVAFMLAMAAVAGRLVQVQALDSERFSEIAATQRERRVILSSQRGSLLDRAGQELAISLVRKTIFANPKFINDPAAVAATLAPIMKLDEAKLIEMLSADSGFVYLARKVEPSIAKAVEDASIPGIEVVSESKRFYPAGTLAAQTLGSVGLDNEGLAGLESAYDSVLAGQPGEMLLEHDPWGRQIAAGKFELRPPVPGDDLILTIDSEIQHAAERALEEATRRWSPTAAMAIVLDIRTGEILALANLPTFDPNDIASSTSAQRRPRAIVDVYEPGSVNKLITAAAALETGVVTPSTIIRAPDRYKTAGKTFTDWKNHPTWDLAFSDVIAFSSNVGTIKVANELGAERLHAYLQKFGYGRPTGLNFPGEPEGLLRPVEDWWQNSLPTIAIGQGVAATPLQIVRAFATVANGGVAMKPRLVSASVSPDGTVRRIGVEPGERVIEESTARILTQILVGVTEGEYGTGKQAQIPGYQIAGKTATAQIPNENGIGYSDAIMGSFMGFAPAGSPRVAVGIMLEDPKPSWGGFTAGPTFKELMEFTLRHLGIGPGPALHNEGTPLPDSGRSEGGRTQAAGL